MQRLSFCKKPFSFSFNMILLPFFCLLLVYFLLFVDQFSMLEEQKTMTGGLISVSAVVLCSIFTYFRYKYGKVDAKFLIAMLLIVGFFIRLSYVVKYGFYQHQHDVEYLGSSGHLSYIYGLSIGEGLPKTNDWQFCHPPLSHWLSSLVVKISTGLGHSLDRAFENIQLLTCLFSTIIMFLSVELFKSLNLKGKGLVIATAFVALHPTFFIFAGSINNDCLTTLFVLCTILFLVKWWYKLSFVYTALIALSIGLGMMTKFSVVLMVPITAVVVLVKLATDNNYKFSRFLGQTSLFLLIAVPLGFWFQIRNYFEFQQPLGYVAPLSTDSQLYIGEISVVERLLLPFSTKPFGTYVDVWEEYNLWYYLLRNSLFGEYQFGNVAIATFLVLFNLALVVLSVLGIVKVVKQGKGMFKKADWIILLTLFVQLAFFVYFNATYPFGCTMDYRYIAIISVVLAFLFGILSEIETEGSIVKTIVSNTLTVSVAGFSALSVLTFI